MTISKLEAVNIMLDAIGEEVVSSLDSGVPDAEKAERFLDRESKRIQGYGWHVNTEYDVTLSADVNGNIQIPASGDFPVLQVDTVGKSKAVDVVVREMVNNQGDFGPTGNKFLYDLGDRTFTFTSDLLVDIIYQFDFENLTPNLQHYIAYEAALRYQQSELGSSVKNAELERLRDEAKVYCFDHETRTRDVNILTGNPGAFRAVYRRNRLFGT